MTITDVQKANLRGVAAYLRGHPDEYDQSIWGHETECGTVMCIGGTAAMLAGYKPDSIFTWDEVSRDDDVEVPIWELASELLGDHGEAFCKPPDSAPNFAYPVSLFDDDWKPTGWTPYLTPAGLAGLVADALEALADGATLADVTYGVVTKEK